MLPVVGIPLPLVSYGGSSVLTMMASIGLLLSVNARRKTF
jgi:rod shape determining protein RodA